MYFCHIYCNHCILVKLHPWRQQITVEIEIQKLHFPAENFRLKIEGL